MTAARIDRFWELLQTNFPLGGPRRHLSELLGKELVTTLMTAGVLHQTRVAATYPCLEHGGAGCPRVVLPLEDGSFQAICGNDPPECGDLLLSEEDVQFLSVAPEALVPAVAKALRVHPGFEALPGLRHVYRCGVFSPEPGVKQPVFLAVRASAPAYAEVLDALRSAQERGRFAVLVPTDRYVSQATLRQMGTLGISILPLAEAVGIEGRKLAAAVDPLRYFAGASSQDAAAMTGENAIVVEAMVGDGTKPPAWRSLDERGYQDLVAAADKYHIFADERAKTVSKVDPKGGPRQEHKKVQPSRFTMIREAVNKKGYFDPGVDGPDLDSAKQVFQRARPQFDLKQSSGDWALFKSVKADDHTVYQFNPDPGVAFALVFLPVS